MTEGLTFTEVEEFKEAFDLFDIDGSGTIDPEEMISAMKDLAIEMKSSQTAELLSNLVSHE